MFLLILGGGIDGLLHITDISWGRVNHPEEVLKLDEKINVVVLDYNDEDKRISLRYETTNRTSLEFIR